MGNPDVAAVPRRTAGPMTLLIVGVCACLVIGGVIVQPSAGWSGLLIAGFFGLTLALGASLFAAINAVAGARWCTPLNAVSAVLGRTLVVPAAVLGVTFLLGLSALYPWARPATVEASHLLHEKVAWLNAPFFLARAGLILLMFVAMTGMLFRNTTIRAGAPSAPSARGAAAFIVLFAAGISVASWDWMMSLEPEWFSTMYGVYAFAGTFVGGIAAMAVVSIFLSESSRYAFHLEGRQLHDLGSLLFGFSMFWAYIWFCQFMLIWYANLPEETPYFALRLSPHWAMLFWLNPIVNFVVPFTILLSSNAKRHPRVLAEVAGVVLAGRWLDTYLMVAPSVASTPVFPVYALAASVGVLLGMIVLGRGLLQDRDMRLAG